MDDLQASPDDRETRRDHAPERILHHPCARRHEIRHHRHQRDRRRHHHAAQTPELHTRERSPQVPRTSSYLSPKCRHRVGGTAIRRPDTARRMVTDSDRDSLAPDQSGRAPPAAKCASRRGSGDFCAPVTCQLADKTSWEAEWHDQSFLAASHQWESCGHEVAMVTRAVTSHANASPSVLLATRERDARVEDSKRSVKKGLHSRDGDRDSFRRLRQAGYLAWRWR
jgi:hypothetical protein